VNILIEETATILNTWRPIEHRTCHILKHCTPCSASRCTGKARPKMRRRKTEEAKRKEERNKYGNEENEISSPRQQQ